MPKWGFVPKLINWTKNSPGPNSSRIAHFHFHFIYFVMSFANSLTPHSFLDCVVWFPEPNPIHNPTAQSSREYIRNFNFVAHGRTELLLHGDSSV
jgi:hypothetical protein